ncbi:Alpha/Beta hydrolase protein [Lipomyces oligophaga]|uniref:Alpha/Beta hydrolase protein n=1 Tax=Lipomyces oligophaga TaxID=45792 RepID=UPI0034CD8922
MASLQMSRPSVAHPLLGRVTGVSTASESVVKFLGIKYGSVPFRFADPLEHVSFDFDASVLGPAAPQPPGGCLGELSHIGCSLVVPDAVENNHSEFDCLHLNIFRPRNIGPQEAIPVLVFVHGGGNVVGSNIWPQFDLTKLVEQSIAYGKPIIAVTLNYRLGPLAMLTSTSMAKAGFTGNLPIKDLTLGFKWVKKYILGFGGNPLQVCALGESAGSMNLSLLLQTPEPLFTRLVCMSGQFATVNPVPLSLFDSIFPKVLEAVQIPEGLSFEEQIKRLSEIPQDVAKLSLLAALPPLFVQTTSLVANDIEDFGSKRYPGYKWCESVLFSDCKNDGSIMTMISQIEKFKPDVAKKFKEYLELNTTSEICNAILLAYNISSSIDADSAYRNFENLVNDVYFYSPTFLAARSWIINNPEKSAYACHFNVKDPWSCAYKSQTPHTFDLALLFQNFNDDMPVELSTISINICHAFLRFIYNENPWDSPIKLVQGCVVNQAVFDEDLATSSRIKLARDLDSAGRRKNIWTLIDKIGWTKTFDLVNGFLFA